MPYDNILDEDNLKICKLNIRAISAGWAVVAETRVGLCVCLLFWHETQVLAANQN